MVPPTRSTPRRKPPSPLRHLSVAHAMMAMPMRTGTMQMRIRPRYRFMVVLCAYLVAGVRFSEPRLNEACLGVPFLLDRGRRLARRLLRFERLFVGQVAGDRALDNADARVVGNL